MDKVEQIKAEIEKRIEYSSKMGDIVCNGSMRQFFDGWKTGCAEILSFLDTIPQEPKFKTGQTIRSKELGAEDTIIGIEEDHYNFRNGGALLISHQGEWELVDKDLEEVAGNYGANAAHQQYYDSNGLPVGIGEELSQAVVYGAEWQKHKDDEMLTAVYMDGVEEGKKQLMKNATVAEYWDNWLVLDPYLRGSFADGDKVKVIIVKEDSV